MNKPGPDRLTLEQAVQFRDRVLKKFPVIVRFQNAVNAKLRAIQFDNMELGSQLSHLGEPIMRKRAFDYELVGGV